MATTAKTTRDIAGFATERAKKRAKAQARKGSESRLQALGNKKFADMTPVEKDELLFRLALDAGLLPGEEE